ncbi:MAG: hypothetical protein ABI681_10600 [Gemmatimonadales bacterium]
MRVVRIVIASSMLLAASPAVSVAQIASPRVYAPEPQSEFAPPVDVWIDQLTYRYGDRIRPYVATEPGAYVTIVRVSSDGELRVLYPRRPWEQKRYALGQFANDRLPFTGDPATNLYESTGTGFVFAIASYQKFDYSYYTSGRSWSIARLARIGGYSDQFEIVRDFIDRTLDERADYSMDYVTYEIIGRGMGSRYASRYGYYSFNDYYELCRSAFGYQYSNYCRSYNNGYYGPFIVVNPAPRTPTQASTRNFKVKPVHPDPIVPGKGPAPVTAEGRMPAGNSAEAAAYARHERMLRSAQPRVEMKADPSAGSRRIEREPQRREREPVMSYPQARSEPRAEPRNDPPRIERPQYSPPMQASPPPPRMERPARIEAPAKQDKQ